LLTGVIVTWSAGIPSFSAPITLSSSSSTCGFSPSYVIGENASETSASRSVSASCVMQTTVSVSLDRCFRIAALTWSNALGND